ncbi:MAG TPA: hypothetical protein VMC82_01300 [Thermoplasmata archaeon]|nr:hypothetical protein [Thermoplasmata archaeon]
MKVRLSASGAAIVIVSALVLVTVLPAAASAAPTADLTPGSTYTLWAYGVVQTVTFSGTSSSHYTYEGSAIYGYSVILNQTNLTSTEFELSANRTMAVDLQVTYCYPDCRAPTVTATVVHDAWESVDAWANFTTEANVSENGQNVSAIGLLNSHTTVHGSLVDLANGLVRDAFLDANVSADASVTFATPLGLLPNELTAPSNWTSSSAFMASGSWSIGYHYHYSGPKGSVDIGPSSVSGDLQSSGNVSVLGGVSVGPGGSVSFGGVPYLNVSLTIIGPFVAREGFILVPEDVDLFGSSASSPWGSNDTGGATVQMTSLYVRPDDPAHLGIGGSEWLYASSAINPAVNSVLPAGPSLPNVDEVAADSDQVSTAPVQGTPVSVAQAQSYQNCLLSGVACPSGSGGGRAGVPGVFLGIVAVVIVAVVATVLVTERRRLPPPSYPNALLYPPGATASAAPPDSTRSGGVRRPPPAEDDPLSNLW